MTSSDALSVLAVTSFRPEEIHRSVTHMDATTQVVVGDSSGTLNRQRRDIYVKTSRALRTGDPDLILLDCYETLGTIVTALAMRHDVPVIARLVADTWSKLESETPESMSSSEDLLRSVRTHASLGLNRFIYSQVDGWVTVSSELQSVVSHRTGCPRDRIGIVPVPLTTDTLERGDVAPARHALGVDEDRVILTVSNLKFREKYEGVRTALSELAPLLQEDTDLAYVVAGSGRYEAALQQDIAEMFEDSVRDRVYLPGYVDAVSDLYALADVFAYVSFLDGYPNAVLEAQTAALPVVANAAHGMVDQITDGETGFLVDPDAPGELRDRVATLLDSPDRRREVGTAARQRVLRENAPAVISQQLEATLRQLLANVRGERSAEAVPSPSV